MESLELLTPKFWKVWSHWRENSDFYHEELSDFSDFIGLNGDYERWNSYIWNQQNLHYDISKVFQTWQGPFKRFDTFPLLKILGFLDLFLLAAQSAAGKTAGVTLCCLITPISQTRLSDGTKGFMLLLLLLSLAVTSLHFNLVYTDQANWLWHQINLTKHQSQVV